MIVVGANFDEVDFISLQYAKTGFGKRFDDTVGLYFPSIPYGTYDVVQQAGLVVAFPYMTVFHATNIHRIALTSQPSCAAIFSSIVSNMFSNTSSFSRVYTMHGIITHADPALFIHRNMNDADRFATHLRNRLTPYVSLVDARAGKGDALTVDDSTHAAADLARMTRALGHDITFFINPWHIETGVAYMPAVLNVLLDTALGEYIDFQNARYFVRTAQERIASRGALRHFLETIMDPEEQVRMLESCANENAIRLELPRHLTSISLEVVQELHTLGVDIQNHGWRHLPHRILSVEQKTENLDKSVEWLQDKLNVDAKEFAVPFGADDEVSSAPGGNWYLLDAKRPEGQIGKGIYNRTLFTE